MKVFKHEAFPVQSITVSTVQIRYVVVILAIDRITFSPINPIGFFVRSEAKELNRKFFVISFQMLKFFYFP